jgi:hypothetical protein
MIADAAATQRRAASFYAKVSVRAELDLDFYLDT